MRRNRQNLALCVAVAATGLLAFGCGHRVTDPSPSPIVYEATYSPNLKWPVGVAVGPNGKIYIADGNNNRVVVLTASGTFDFQIGPPGSRTVVNFLVPMGIAIDGNGFVYVTDSQHHRVMKFTADGARVDSVGTFGSPGSSLGQFDVPATITVGPGGVLYVGETGATQRIQKLTLNLVPVLVWGSFGTQNGQFNDPQGVVTDPQGLVYVADFDNERIQVFGPNGNFIRSWGSAGSAPGQFNQPRNLAIDSDSRLYVTDGNIGQVTNNRVQIFTLEGKLLGTFGSFGGPGSGPTHFDTPWGITVEGDRLLVVDRTNDRVQVYRILPRALTR